MIEYHKIQSVFLRDPATKHRTFLTNQWSMPEFGYLADRAWLWTEKIDGTNVRVHWNGERVQFGGRTEDAQMPIFLLNRLEQLFSRPRMAAQFPDSNDVMLFGEGFGAKIQKGGGNYIPDGQDFILFDALIGGTYLTRDNVVAIAAELNIRVVPIVGRGTLYDAIVMAHEGFHSAIGSAQAEGLVMRPAVELFTRLGDRIITKVKHKDFVIDAIRTRTTNIM